MTEWCKELLQDCWQFPTCIHAPTWPIAEKFHKSLRQLNLSKKCTIYKQTCEYSCSKALMSHNMNLLSSHFTISRALHSCETENRKVKWGLTPNKNGNCAEFFFKFRLLIKVNENHAFMQKIYVLPSCWSCLHTQGTTTCGGQNTHI